MVGYHRGGIGSRLTRPPTSRIVVDDPSPRHAVASLVEGSVGHIRSAAETRDSFLAFDAIDRVVRIIQRTTRDILRLGDHASRELLDEVDLFRSQFVIVAHSEFPLLPIHDPRVVVVALWPGET